MASAQKISELTTAGPLTGAELVPIVQNSGTLQTTVSVVAAFAIVSLLPVVSALGTQIANVSAQLGVQTSVINVLANDLDAVEIQVAAVSAYASVNAAAITSVNNVVSALEVRVSAVSATGVANSAQIAAVSALVSSNTVAITSTNAVVSALDTRIGVVSAATSVNAAQIAAVSALVSTNTAAITSINAVTSTLDVRVSVLEAALSAIGDVSAIAGLVSTVAILDADVSALEIRMAAVSAATSVNSAAITSINAVVSTKVNRVGDFMDSVQYIEFDTSTVQAVSVGRLSWDIEYGTLDIGLAGGNANLLIGQREVMYIYNNSGVTLPKGKVVEVTGAQGQRLAVKLAQANNDANSATVLGVMLETVSVNNSGYVATNGIVREVNTGAFTDGQIVYLSPVSAGELTATKPVAPQHMVMIGYIVKGGSVGAGSLYVKTQNGYEIGELHDVKTSASSSIADGEVLAWNTSASVWTNSPALINAQASISALNIQVAAVSALASVNAAAITSINNAVSALEVRVSAASATGVTNAAAITSINNVVSAVQAQVNAVSVSVGQRVLRAGDTMTGALTISTSADAQGLTVNGFGTFTSRVSVSAGFYTGLQNYQDNTLQRATFRDYALVLVARGSVSATTTLDMTEGNFFAARVAGSTTFVFANPPVSVTGAAGGAAGGFVLELQNGGAATVTWPGTVDWPGGTAPTLTSSGFDVIVCITDDAGTNWRCVQSMRDSK